MTAFYLTEDPKTVEYQGKPIAMFGVVRDDHDEQVGKVWLLGTDEFSRQRSFIVKNSKEILDSLFESYTVLWNFIDARQLTHIRWLKWLGFDFIDTVQDYGAAKIPFHQFAKVVQHV